MRIIKDMKLREYIETKLLVDDWSPEQIAGRLAQGLGLESVSTPTIYKYIRSVYGRQLEYELQLAKQKRKKKHQRKVSQLEGRVFIDKRPEAANDRSQYGHWEGVTSSLVARLTETYPSSCYTRGLVDILSLPA
jgi:IS30 family transposase